MYLKIKILFVDFFEDLLNIFIFLEIIIQGEYKHFDFILYFINKNIYQIVCLFLTLFFSLYLILKFIFSNLF
jgi:hypothetical protein